MTPAHLSARFGYGRAPGLPDPARPEDLLAPLTGPDRAAARFPIPRFADLRPEAQELQRITRAARAAAEPERSRLLDERREMRRTARLRQAAALGATLARAAHTGDPLRERLTRFWADHFTVIGRNFFLRGAVTAYVEEAIRPHVAGRFADMLKAAILHPQMLIYLDQSASVGPNSRAARQRPGRGLNENLARELLELHTVGVAGGYSQADVRQLAELLAGLTGNAPAGLRFTPGRGEPGAETVLGRSYGGRMPRIADIHAVLDDLARHPATARHVAAKLATHFVADAPDPALVDHLAARFAATDGDLAEVTAALLTHPAALEPTLAKAKRPFDFVASALRALAVPGEALIALRPHPARIHLAGPLELMGQPWESPQGPDGWPEVATHWITPQGLAARIDWALALPGLARRTGAVLPDPRAFVDTALGPLAGEAVRFAARAAETRQEGLALVLAAPEFQRR
mgnify:FL=1